MFFIHIATYTNVEDFTSWLSGKNRIAFNDSQEFKIWLDGQNTFPLDIYLNGVTLRFTCKNDIEYFQLGFNMAIELRIRNA